MYLAQGHNTVTPVGSNPQRIGPKSITLPLSDWTPSTGFDEMSWTIILPEKQKSRILYDLDKD